MPQIQKGTTFATGDTVTASSLNGLVDGASLTGQAITAQTALTPAGTDYLLIAQGANLGKALISQVTGLVNTSGFIKADGTVAMTAPLTLSSTAAVSALSAASKGYVDAQVFNSSIGYTPVNKTGDTMSGNLTMQNASTVVLNRNPASALEAAPKQYVDGLVTGFATATQLSAHTTNTSNPHSTTAAQVGLGNVNNTSDVAKPISTAQQAALDLKLNLTGGTLTGALGLPAADPTQPTQAAHKSYVDQKLALSGGTLTGSLSIPSGNLSLNAALQTTSTSAIVKSQLDALPKAVCRGVFSNATVATNTLSKAEFIDVTVGRINGSTQLIVNFPIGAPYNYNNAFSPFFVVGQYVGIEAQTGLTGKLYQITFIDNSIGRFYVTTTETTAIGNPTGNTYVAGKLSCIYNSYANPSSKNINLKSLYIDMSAKSKYYANYQTDLLTGSQTNTTPTSVTEAIVSGALSTYLTATTSATLYAVPLPDYGRTANTSSQNVQEGFGSNSMGCHIGFFSSPTAGAGYDYAYQAAFAINR